MRNLFGGRGGLGAVRAVGMRGVSILATFALSATVARVLGPEDAGLFFLVYTLLALFATLGRFGTDNLALRLLGGDTSSARADILGLIRLACVTGAFAVVPAALVIALCLRGGVAIGSVIIVATCVFAQALAVLSGTVLRGLGLLAAGVFAELGSLPTIATPLVIVAGTLPPGSNRLQGSLAAIAIAAWVTVAWALPVALAQCRRKLTNSASVVQSSSSFRRQHARRLFSMMGTSLMAYGMVWAPIFVLSATSSLTEVSYYSVALRVANVVALVPTIQISYLAPEFARRFYSGDLLGLNRLARRSTLQVIGLTVLPLLLLVTLAEPIVRLLFGEEFLPAAPIMRILSVGVFIGMAFGQVNQLMLLCGLEGSALALTSAALTVWASAGIVVGILAGAIGIAWLAALIAVTYAACGAITLRMKKGIRSYARIQP